jgi:hypothetical protein
VEIELGFQPNCSEVVLHIPNLKKRQLLARLKKIGIHEEVIEGYYEWSPNEKERVIVDCDNPALPDYRWHSILRILNDYTGCGSYKGGCCVVGNQHCQTQMFPTMKKIRDFVVNEHGYDTEWQGDDGGSEWDYENWIKQGCKPVINMDEMMKVDVYVTGLKPDLIDKVKHDVLACLGLKMTLKKNLLTARFDPDKAPSCAMHPSRFIAHNREIQFVGRTRSALARFVEELKGQPCNRLK